GACFDISPRSLATSVTLIQPPASAYEIVQAVSLRAAGAFFATREARDRRTIGLMRTSAAILLSISLAAASASAQQETTPVPKDSVRVAIPGCTKGYVFTAGPRTVEEPGNFEIREGMHLRMNGPKKLMAEIKAHEGSMIELTGLMKKGQYVEGVNIGGGVRVSPGPNGVGVGISSAGSQIQIDVEGWRQIEGACRTQ